LKDYPVIYVRHGKKDKIQTGFSLNGTYTDYNVIGENWRYIAADVDAGKNSEKKQWSSLAKNIITSNGIGGGKENTERAKIKAESFVCPIIYYDDDGNVVK